MEYGNVKFAEGSESVQDYVKRFTASILTKIGLGDSTVIIEPVGKPGDNYTSTVKRFFVETDSKTERIRLIVKIAPIQEVVRQMMNIGIIFGNEISIYNELFPKYETLQRYDVPENERMTFPYSYGTSTEGPGEIIIFQDLTYIYYYDPGFKMLNKFVSLKNDEIKIVVKELAKFHALSFALKHDDPDFYEKFTKQLINVWEVNAENKEFAKMVKLLEASAIAAIDNEQYKNYLKGCMTNLPKYVKSSSVFDRQSKHAVILHGDCWTNNIFFRYEENLPKEVVLIDYQMGMIGSPAIELMYLILNCTDHETRSKHYYGWLDYYYESFEQFLFHFGLKANILYSREKLDADLQRYSKISFGTSVLLSSMLVQQPNDVEDIEDKNQEDKKNNDTLNPATSKPSSQNLYKTKVEDLIRSFVEFGYITGQK